MPAHTEAARLITALHTRGWTDSAIGRAVGRDSSLIAQGARGAKPLHNLIPAFKELTASGQAPPSASERAPRVSVPRRTGRAGTTAKVRAAGKTQLGGTNIEYRTKKGYKTLQRELRAAERQNKQVAMRLRFQHVKSKSRDKRDRHREVELFSKGGWDAQRLLNELNSHNYAGDPAQALTELAQALPYMEDVRGLESVEIVTFDRSRTA
jgi:hypothetical protein